MRGVGEPLGAQEVHVPHQKLRGDGEASPVDEQVEVAEEKGECNAMERIAKFDKLDNDKTEGSWWRLESFERMKVYGGNVVHFHGLQFQCSQIWRSASGLHMKHKPKSKESHLKRRCQKW